jgi:uncharacterized protein (DUF305 family)
MPQAAKKLILRLIGAKNMIKQTQLYGISGLLIGSLFGILVARAAANNEHAGMMRIMGMAKERSAHDPSGHGMTMDYMTEEIKGKSGDEFDKAFLVTMTQHHQGAIEMANLVKQKAKHDELKQMANTIISAQSGEIDQMHTWLHDWGYIND